MMEGRIAEELAAIKKELAYIREHMVDIDSILTKDEEKILEESIKEFEEGKTIPLEKLKRE